MCSTTHSLFREVLNFVVHIGAGFTDRHMEMMMPALSHAVNACSLLSTLSLVDNELCDTSARVLAANLAENRCLTVLDVSGECWPVRSLVSRG